MILLNIRTTIGMSINVADQYSHKLFKNPETSAGAKERAGFISRWLELNPIRLVDCWD